MSLSAFYLSFVLLLINELKGEDKKKEIGHSCLCEWSMLHLKAILLVLRESE